MNSQDKTIAFNGGKMLAIFYQDKPEAGGEPLKVRQIPIREYEAGFNHVNDEIALVGFLAGKDKDWAMTLRPDSYENVLTVGREVNHIGFFTFCRRRTERLQQQEADLFARMKGMSPDVMEAIISMGRKSTSPTSPPGFHPPRV